MAKNSFAKGFSAVAILIIAAIVLAGIGGAVLLRRPSSDSSSTGAVERTAESTESVDTDSENTSTLPDIIGRGESLECDWRMPTGAEENPFGTGKLYTTANKGRSMITGNSSGVAIEGNAIYRDNEVYSWITVAGTTMGFKFSEAELSELNSSMTEEERQQAESIRSEMIVNCSPWTPDESMFTLPAGVNFE